jgi:hypothetical protein
VILTDGSFPPQSFQDVYWRFFGVVLILDALATVALPVTTLIIRSQHKNDAPSVPVKSASSAKTVTIELSGVAATWVVAQAADKGTTTDKVVSSLIAAARKK